MSHADGRAVSNETRKIAIGECIDDEARTNLPTRRAYAVLEDLQAGGPRARRRRSVSNIIILLLAAGHFAVVRSERCARRGQHRRRTSLPRAARAFPLCDSGHHCGSHAGARDGSIDICCRIAHPKDCEGHLVRISGLKGFCHLLRCRLPAAAADIQRLLDGKGQPIVSRVWAVCVHQRQTRQVKEAAVSRAP